MSLKAIESFVRDVPDFPKPGIMFKDITPLLGDAPAFQAAIDAMCAPHAGVRKLAAIESRGFLLAAAMASKLGAGLVPLRKKGKLPARTLQQPYGLEYGSDVIEMHEDALRPGEEVLVVDDVLATGGTAEAACRLVERAGAKVSGLSFLIELAFLKGRVRLPGRPIHAVLTY